MYGLKIITRSGVFALRHFFAIFVSLCTVLLPNLAAAFDEGNPATAYYVADPGRCPAVSQPLYLHQHKGKYVELLLPDTWENTLTVDERRTMLDRADIVYQYYKEILQVEPVAIPGRANIGLLRIAVIPPNCINGNAWTGLGKKEMEIGDDTSNLQMYKAELGRGLETNRQITSHELGHAFDLWGDYLEYESTCDNSSGTNWCHAWTDIWDAFIPYYGRVGGVYEYLVGQDLTADAHQRWWTHNSYDPYYTKLDNQVINWNTAVKNEWFLSLGIKARDSWAGTMDRYVQLYGTDAMLKAMAYTKNYVVTHPSQTMTSTTQEQKEYLHIMSMAVGASANLSCLLDEWRWYGSDATQPDQKALRDEMAKLFGPPQNNAVCRDNDGDGFTPLKGDCNDSNASVNPLAAETLNGVDDNCNGVVDDVTPLPPVPVPLDPWGKVAPPAKQGSNYMLSSKMLRLDAPIVSELPTKIRFWVTGVGVVGTIPYAQDAYFLWTPPAGLVTGTYGVRAQLMTDTKPVSEFTAAEWFSYGDPCTPDRYEAETMYHSTGNAYDQGWNVFNNGYISFNHSFAAGMQQMTVRAAGQNGAGWPNMQVTVGGVQVFNGTIATTQWTDYTFSFYAQPGSAEVRVYFTNDYFVQPPGQPVVDRNLLVDKVTLASRQCGLPIPINLGPANVETKFPVNASQAAVINQLSFSGWTPSQIVLGIGHTDAANLSGVSVSINGGAPIALSGDWRTINIPYTGQSVINLTIYSATPRAIRTQWWGIQ